MTSSLWALARRLVPLDVLRGKVDAYIEAGYLDESERDAYVETLERMHGVLREYNVHAQADGAASAESSSGGVMMSDEELRAELRRREELLQAAPAPTVLGQRGRLPSTTASPVRPNERGTASVRAASRVRPSDGRLAS